MDGINVNKLAVDMRKEMLDPRLSRMRNCIEHLSKKTNREMEDKVKRLEHLWSQNDEADDSRPVVDAKSRRKQFSSMESHDYEAKLASMIAHNPMLMHMKTKS